MTNSPIFNERLEKGEKFERYVIKTIQEKYNRKYIKNPDKTWVDLIWEKWNIEVKHDDMFEQTWNFYIEILFRWKRSGILKYKNVKYYCIWNYDEFYWIEIYKLMKLLLLYWDKKKGWNKMRCIGYTIPKKIVKEHADFNF